MKRTFDMVLVPSILCLLLASLLPFESTIEYYGTEKGEK